VEDGGVLQLPLQDTPFPVSFEREAEARQRRQAQEQAQRIAALEATELSSADSAPAMDGDGSDMSLSNQGDVWAGQFGEFGVMDSSDDLEDFLGNEDWHGDWD
jgi:hypothetical protein